MVHAKDTDMLIVLMYAALCDPLLHGPGTQRPVLLRMEAQRVKYAQPGDAPPLRVDEEYVHVEESALAVVGQPVFREILGDPPATGSDTELR